MSTTLVIPRRLVFLVALVLAGCGGGGGADTPPPPAASPAPAPRVSAPTEGSGTLVVTVTDEDGRALSAARVTVFNATQDKTIGTADADRDGRVTFARLPDTVRLSALHPLGRASNNNLAVSQGSTTPFSLVVPADSPVTVALMPMTVSAAGLSADRSELDIPVTIIAPQFIPSGYGTAAASPSVGLEDCYVWLDTGRTEPACSWTSRQGVTALAYQYDKAGKPALAGTGPYATLLLLDQSRRVRSYDPHDLRTLAAKRFVAGLSPSHPVAVAGFAASDADATSPPLMPQLPFWRPPVTTAVFSADRVALRSAVDTLEPLTGGAAPLFAGLENALTLMALQAPGSQRRALVVLLGGEDDSGLTPSRHRAAVSALQRLQADTGAQIILVAGRIEDSSPQRMALAELATSLRAPIIFSSYLHTSHTGSGTTTITNYDGLYAAMDLAAQLLAGTPLQSINAVFRMRSQHAGGFVAGSVLQGRLAVELNYCGMGCAELPLQFAVTIP